MAEPDAIVAAGVEGALGPRPPPSSRSAPRRRRARSGCRRSPLRARPPPSPRRPHSRAGRETASRPSPPWRAALALVSITASKSAGSGGVQASGRTVNSGATTGSSPSARARAAVSSAPGCGRRIRTGRSSARTSRASARARPGASRRRASVGSGRRPRRAAPRRRPGSGSRRAAGSPAPAARPAPPPRERQSPPSAASKARSASTQRWVGAWSIAASSARISSRSARISTPIAPCAGAGSMPSSGAPTSRGRAGRARPRRAGSRRPRRARAWRAGSATLPRIGTISRSGRRAQQLRARGAARRCRPARPRARRAMLSAPTSRSRGVGARQHRGDRQRGGPDRLDVLHRMDREVGRARRAAPRSSSLVHSALPPTSASGRSWIRSPLVVIGTISIASRRQPWAARSAAATILRLGERERRAAGADAEGRVHAALVLAR